MAHLAYKIHRFLLIFINQVGQHIKTIEQKVWIDLILKRLIFIPEHFGLKILSLEQGVLPRLEKTKGQKDNGDHKGDKYSHITGLNSPDNLIFGPGSIYYACHQYRDNYIGKHCIYNDGQTPVYGPLPGILLPAELFIQEMIEKGVTYPLGITDSK